MAATPHHARAESPVYRRWRRVRVRGVVHLPMVVAMVLVVAVIGATPAPAATAPAAQSPAAQGDAQVDATAPATAAPAVDGPAPIPALTPSPAASAIPSAAELDSYLAAHGSPIAGQGAAFVASGSRWQVDPRLLVAIAGAESSFGQITCAPYNAWGWGCPSNAYSFDSWADGIDAVAEGLRTNYLAEGRTSVALIHQKYAPVGAGNDPTGLNNYWTVNVSRFLTEMGGDPNDVDLSGVGGTMPLGLEFGAVAAGAFDFTVVDDASGTSPRGEAPAATRVAAGSATSMVVSVRNTGTTTWTAETVRLRRVDIVPEIGGAPYGALEGGRPVPAGAEGRFRVDLTVLGDDGGVHRTLWRLEGPGGPFGAEIPRDVEGVVPGLVAGESTVEVRDAGGARMLVVRVQNAGSRTWHREGDGAVVLDARESAGAPIGAAGTGGPVHASMLERSAAPGEWATFAAAIDGTDGALLLGVRGGGSWASGAPIIAVVGSVAPADRATLADTGA